MLQLTFILWEWLKNKNDQWLSLYLGLTGACKPYRWLLLLLDSTYKCRIVTKKSSIPKCWFDLQLISHFDSLPVTTSPRNYELDVQDENCVEEEEPNKPSTSHDSEETDDLTHNLTNWRLKNRIFFMSSTTSTLSFFGKKYNLAFCCDWYFSKLSLKAVLIVNDNRFRSVLVGRVVHMKETHTNMSVLLNISTKSVGI